MFGPYLVACDDCSFEEHVKSGEDAQNEAESHSDRHDHAVRITEVNTGANAEVNN